MNADAAKRAKIIEKVRALLSMTTANGCTEAEAMTAAGMASKLMEEYDLALGDVRSLEDERIAQQSKPFYSAERPREMHAAGIYVAPAVGEFFDCKIWRSYTEIIFFGLRDDVDLAHTMLAMIRFAMDRELSQFMKSDAAKSGEHPRSVAASFLRGMGHRISERLRQIKAERTANVRAKGKDLVVIKGAIVDAAFAAQFPNLKPARPLTPPKSAIAYSAGFAAGDRVNLGQKEVAASSGAKLRFRSAKRDASAAWSAAPRRSLADLLRRGSIRAVKWVAGRIAAMITLVARVCGFAGIFASLFVFNAALEMWIYGGTYRAGFMDWLVDRQPLWAGLSAACIACTIRLDRMQTLDERASFRADIIGDGRLPSAQSLGSSALHILYFTALSAFVFFGSRLAPQIRERFTTHPEAPLLDHIGSLVLGEPQWWLIVAIGVAWIAAGYILATHVFALARFGRI